MRFIELHASGSSCISCAVSVHCNRMILNDAELLGDNNIIISLKSLDY